MSGQDVIAGVKADAKRFRALAATKRKAFSEIKARTRNRCRSEDALELMKLRTLINEYANEASKRDALVAELRIQFPRRSHA